MGEDSESYMEHAENDLAAAERLDGDDKSDTYARTFHAQQAAEKAMKAVIAASGREPQWTHDLVELARNLPAGCTSGTSNFDLAVLSAYAFTSRHGSTKISKNDGGMSLGIAKEVMDAMRACL